MFQNRQEAGRLLAEKLKKYKNRQNSIVYSIPRGGVVVGKQIADILNIPLDVVIVKKLGAPGNPELAIGAVAGSDVYDIDQSIIPMLGIEKKYIDKELKNKLKEIEERKLKFRIRNPTFAKATVGKQEVGSRNFENIIITDDGVATGATTLMAIRYIKLRAENPAKQDPAPRGQKPNIVLAVPVISRDTYEKIKLQVDELIALEVPESFSAVGQFYKEFGQIGDEEVVENLTNNR